MVALANIGTAVYNAMTADSGVMAWCGTVQGMPQVYEHEPLPTATLPFYLFYAASQVNMNDSPRVQWNSVYRIEALAETPGAAQAGAEHVYTLFHGKSVTLDGYGNIWCMVAREQHLLDVDDTQARTYRRILDIEIDIAE